jgi:hypothetical protein
MSAVDMPRSFALDAAESAVDYDYVLIGESKYLLPVHSEALSCLRGTSDCTRNVIEFRDYTPVKDSDPDRPILRRGVP